MRKKIRLPLIIILSLFAGMATTKAQGVKFVADIQAVGIGLKQQSVTLGNHTNIASITGMSGINAGLNIPIIYNFEASATIGFLMRLNFSSSTSYSSSGTQSSSESSSFFVPKFSGGLAKAFIFSKRKFVQGIKLGGGLDYYWPGDLKFSGNGDDLQVEYADNYGYFIRGQLAFRPFKKVQIIPNITYRNFTFEATEYKQGPLNSLDESLRTLEGRNIEVGIIFLL